MCLAGYKDVCTRLHCLRLRGAEISALGRGFAEGTEWTTVLTTLVEYIHIYIYILMKEMRYDIIALVVACLVL